MQNLTQYLAQPPAMRLALAFERPSLRRMAEEHDWGEVYPRLPMTVPATFQPGDDSRRRFNSFPGRVEQ